jgi:hypothetical protein
MSVLNTEQVAPQLFECFLDRTEAGLPENYLSMADGVLVAGPDLLRPLEAFPESYESWGYRSSIDGSAYERPLKGGSLDVRREGNFWFMHRAVDDGEDGDKFQVLVVAFEDVPICTRTFEDAIRLAEHCHPETRAPMAGYWFTYLHAR